MTLVKNKYRFKKKTEKELKALTYARIKAYYKAERNRYDADRPFCNECYEYHWEYEGQEKEFEAWYKYLMFVYAIMKEKEKDGKEN
jgi:hypothetical protein